jgi:GNAT superfamily N-acetyltransferase
MATLRAFRPADLEALYDICLRTADNGADATHLYRDPRIVGEIFAAPYAAFHPDFIFVAEDDAGLAGYILGAPDTRAFEARCEAEWWPALRRRYADPASTPSWQRTREQWDAYYIHHPPPNPQPVVDLAPAHLHIDLLPRLQGQGVGKTLMARWLAGVGDRAHLGCQAENLRAQRFYEIYGFRRVEGVGPRSVVWMTIGA